MTEVIKEYHRDRIQYGYYDEDKYFVFHNDNGPSTIWYKPSAVYQEYRNHGKLHRIGKPAVIYRNNSFTSTYFVHGVNVSRQIYDWSVHHNTPIDKLSEEDYYALCFFMEGLK